MSWETKKLCDLCLVITKGTTPSNIGEGFTEYGVKYIRSEMITSARNISGEFLFISPETHEKLKRSQLQAGDILFSMAGVYLGKTALLREEDVPANTNQAVALIRVDRSKYNHQFIYYYLNLPQIISVVNTIQSQSAQPNINLKQIGNLEIKLPNPLVQKKIADILSAYDDLVENNRKQIKLLEEAAQRLYKEWFVDLRFPGHEHTKIVDGVPEGWDYIPFGEVVCYEIGGGWGEALVTGKNECPGFVIRGTDIDRIKQGDLLSIPYRFHGHGNLASRELQDGDIIFEVSGGSKNTGVAKTLLITKDLLNVWQEPVICASFCKLVRCHKVQTAQYIYDCLQYWRAIGETQEYEKKSASSIINYRWKDFLEQKYVLLPEEALLQRYYAISSSLYKQAVMCSIRILKATQARDRLLPKLMSGEITV